MIMKNLLTTTLFIIIFLTVCKEAPKSSLSPAGYTQKLFVDPSSIDDSLLPLNTDRVKLKEISRAFERDIKVNDINRWYDPAIFIREFGGK